MDRTQQLLLLNAVAMLGVSAYFVVSYDIGGGHVTDRARKSEIPMNSLSGLGLGEIAGGAVSGSAFRKKWADNDATIPVVSLIALSNGQYWCNRNSLQNACYQDYPHAKLELLLAETSVAPSPLYLAANLTGLWGCVTMRYWWFNSSEPSGPLNPPLGGLRDMLLDAGRGDVLIFMDNDDFYHPHYVESVVGEFEPFRLPTDSKVPHRRMYGPAVVMMEGHPNAHINPDGTLFMELSNKPLIWGGHMTSMTPGVLDECPMEHRHVHRALNEEKRFHNDCVAGHNITLRRMHTSKDGVRTTDNGMLLIKFASGLSVAHQKWGHHDEMRRLSTRDWQDVLASQAWHYETLHEVTRPPGQRRLPYNATTTDWGGPSRFFRIPTVSGGSELSLKTWSTFQRRNVDFWSKTRQFTSFQQVLKNLQHHGTPDNATL